MQPPLTPGDSVELTIDDLSYGGDGVGHPGGFAVFVPRTAPGDRLNVQIRDVRRRYARGIVEGFLEQSPQHVKPNCSHFAECGGCHVQHLSPEFVRELKKKQLHETFKRIGPGEIPIRDFVTSGMDWGYRNRTTYHRGGNGNQGYIAWTDHRVLDVENCPIADPDLNELWSAVRKATRDISADHLPYVVLRKTSTGELAILFSLTVDPLPALKSLKLPHDPFLYSTQIRPGSFSPFGKEIRTLAGPDHVTEEVREVRYSVRPDLFFQVHTEVAVRVVDRVVQEAKALTPKRALDIYCGAGLLTLALAREGIPTLGVEVQYAAIQCAQKSAEQAKLNSLASFRAGKADRILERLSREKEEFDLVVVDPPRGGLHPKVIGFIGKLGARAVLYLSCAPATLARDLKIFKTFGFSAQWAEPFDMFPQTYHFEVLTKLSTA